MQRDRGSREKDKLKIKSKKDRSEINAGHSDFGYMSVMALSLLTGDLCGKLEGKKLQYRRLKRLGCN